MQHGGDESTKPRLMLHVYVDAKVSLSGRLRQMLGVRRQPRASASDGPGSWTQHLTSYSCKAQNKGSSKLSMDGELIRGDAHHASVQYLIILQYLLLDSEFIEATWGGSRPAASRLWALYWNSVRFLVCSSETVVAETLDCKGLWVAWTHLS